MHNQKVNVTKVVLNLVAVIILSMVGISNALAAGLIGNIGIGSTSPGALLVVGYDDAPKSDNSGANFMTAAFSGTQDAWGTTVTIDAFSDGTVNNNRNAVLAIRSSDDHVGKYGVPATVGNNIGSITFEAVGNTTGATRRAAYIHSTVESVQSTTVGASIEFLTTNSSGVTNEVMRVSGSSNMGIGSTNPGAKLDINGSARLVSAGNKLYIKEGTNACMGVTTLSSGTATVSTSCITANSRVSLTLQNCSSCGFVYLGTVTAGTSFVINSSNGADASNVYWQIVDKI